MVRSDVQRWLILPPLDPCTCCPSRNRVRCLVALPPLTFKKTHWPCTCVEGDMWRHFSVNVDKIFLLISVFVFISRSAHVGVCFDDDVTSTCDRNVFYCRCSAGAWSCCKITCYDLYLGIYREFYRLNIIVRDFIRDFIKDFAEFSRISANFPPFHSSISNLWAKISIAFHARSFIRCSVLFQCFLFL